MAKDPIPSDAKLPRRPVSITIDAFEGAIVREVERIGARVLLADIETHRANRLALPSQPVGRRRKRVYKAGGGAKECARRLARMIDDEG